MNKKQSVFKFQRDVSQASSGREGTPEALNVCQDVAHLKKRSSKVKSHLKETGKSKQGAGYLMSKKQLTLDVTGDGSASNGELGSHQHQSNGVLARNVNLNNLDVGPEKCPGGMSVTDIELTMSEEDKPPLASPQSNWANQQSPNGVQLTPVVSASEGNPKNMVKCLPKLLPAKCTDALCDNKSCYWHSCVLDRPHRVKWMDTTVRVELKKEKGQIWPGFDHRVKRHKKKDEYYAIVTRIYREGTAANSGLCVGDLILSVNSVPLQDNTIQGIALEQEDYLIFQIQHPEDITPNSADVVQGQVSSVGSWTIPQGNKQLQQPMSPTSSPSDAFMALSPNNENIPLFPLSKPTGVKFQPLPQATIFVCGNSAREFVHCLIGDKMDSFGLLNSCANFIGVSMKMVKEQSSSLPLTVDNLIAVDHWESFSYLFRENEVRVQASANPQGSSTSLLLPCINVRLVVVEDDNFFHHCCPWMFFPNSLYILTFDANRLLSSSELEMSRLKRIAYTVRTGKTNVREMRRGAAAVGGLGAAAAPSSPVSPTNACSSLMIVGVTSAQHSNLEEIRALFYTSLGETLGRPDVIHTNKGHSSPEMTKLRQDIFTTLTQCNNNSASCLSTAASCPAFTGTTWAMPGTLPKDPSATSPKDSYQVSQMKVSFSTAVALDIIANYQSLTISQSQLMRMLQEWCQSLFNEEGSAPGTGRSSFNQPFTTNGAGVHQQESPVSQVIEFLCNTKNLILLDSLNLSCKNEGDREYVLSAMLFDKLVRLAQASEAVNLSEADQNTLRSLSARGIVSRPEILHLLNVVASNPERLLLCLEDLKVTFSVKTAQQTLQQQEGDSGFDEGLSVLFPFFKHDLPFDPHSLEGFELYWIMQFSVEVPLICFYSILAELSLHWPTGTDLSLLSQLVAQVVRVAHGNGLPNQPVEPLQHPPTASVYVICFLQTERQIKAFKKRASSCGAGPLCKDTEMNEHLQTVAASCMPGCVEIHSHQSQPSPVTTPPLSIVHSPALRTLPPFGNLMPSFTRGRYTGNFQVPLPEHLVTEEEEEEEKAAVSAKGATARPANVDTGEQEEAHLQMMDTLVAELVFVDTELKKICEYLSIQEDWKTLAGKLGLSTFHVGLIESTFPSTPGALPGQIFLDKYMLENGLTVRRLLRALLAMPRSVYHGLAEKLWTAALLNNSRYYINLYRSKEM
ncbi:hypothetical protein PoB_004208800 [Plakobranchus ocellatus]|uniref:PDZ domain-containing protein n=1 Tax=Plakobranchus ocellatus TaxID=259542 RepID=A0AAV4B9U7_9GAST|nr:hypothetical protein PoB_004208800 [Plakobranchus ocellatus]